MSAIVASIATELEHAGSAIESLAAVALILDGEPRTGAEIVRLSGRPRSSVYRHLSAFVDAGLAEKSEAGYVRSASSPRQEETRAERWAPKRPAGGTSRRPRQAERTAAEQLERDADGQVRKPDPEEVERRIEAIRNRTERPSRAPACGCDRPMRGTDEDGDPICGRCGRTAEGLRA